MMTWDPLQITTFTADKWTRLKMGQYLFDLSANFPSPRLLSHIATCLRGTRWATCSTSFRGSSCLLYQVLTASCDPLASCLNRWNYGMVVWIDASSVCLIYIFTISTSQLTAERISRWFSAHIHANKYGSNIAKLWTETHCRSIHLQLKMGLIPFWLVCKWVQATVWAVTCCLQIGHWFE